MPYRYLSTALLLGGALLSSCHASAQPVDFDSGMIRLEDYLVGSIALRGRDGDDNGINEDDQLGMLSALLAGRYDSGCIAPATVDAIAAGFAANQPAVESELTVTVGSQGTVNLVDQLSDIDADLGQSLVEVIAGIMTIADTETVAYVNSLADQVIVKVLTGTPEEDEIVNVQAQINFQAANFATYGSAGDEPDELGAAGDLDGDTLSNLNEYASPPGRTREEWLEAQCLDAPLRLKTFEGGGSRITGLKMDFIAEAAGGTGSFTYAWQKGVPGSSTPLTLTNTYTIDFLRTSDAGNYFCIIDDGDTTLITPVRNLGVTFVPIIISKQLVNLNRVTGDPATFEVGVQGGSPGPYTFTWTKDGAPIGGANASTYTIPSVQASDEGQYAVSVTSNGGPDAKTSGPVTLDVVNDLPPLNITAQPQDATVVVGVNHTFSVTVTGGSGDFRYQWKKNNLDIPGATSRQLRFLPVAPADEGDYACRITDGSPSVTPVTSDSAALLVTVAPLEFTVQPQSKTVEAGEDVYFTVAVTGGSGQYAYQWKKDGEVLPATPSDPVLELIDVVGASEGAYACTVFDVIEPIDPITSNEATLTVNEPDDVSVTLQPVGIVGYSGDDFVLTLAATGGSGNFRYDWYKDAAKINGVDSPTLSLSPLDFGDEAQYRCEIVDIDIPGFQAVTDTVTVEVADRIDFSVEPLSQDLLTGDPLALAATATGGHPPVSYQWYKDGAPIGGATDASLDLGGAELADAGSYWLVAEDSATDDETSATADIAVELIPVPASPATFEIDMFGTTVVPPSNSPNVGFGEGSLRRKGATSAEGAVVRVTITHSIGFVVPGETPTALLLHEGAPGTNGPLMADFESTEVALDASVDVTEEQASKILAGNAYLLFTSSSNPTGDIRGNIDPVIVDVAVHTGDPDGNNAISLSELLRVIQFFNSDGISCSAGSEDGYAPGPGSQSCPNHSSDYNPADWDINLSELLRLIQFYNAGGYYDCEEATEDGFCPGQAP